mmetsp:Transcript_24210/g.62914  ORF Transcript_24210/g.62914 Transcript_24210/m.62914 type:complete len:113 (+) Transcript_24210:822-1160(+)
MEANSSEAAVHGSPLVDAPTQPDLAPESRLALVNGGHSSCSSSRGRIHAPWQEHLRRLQEIPLALMEVLAAGAGWEEEGLGEEGEGKVAEETEVEGWGAREEEGLEAREEEG